MQFMLWLIKDTDRMLLIKRLLYLFFKFFTCIFSVILLFEIIKISRYICTLITTDACSSIIIIFKFVILLFVI